MTFNLLVVCFLSHLFGFVTISIRFSASQASAELMLAFICYLLKYVAHPTKEKRYLNTLCCHCLVESPFFFLRSFVSCFVSPHFCWCIFQSNWCVLHFTFHISVVLVVMHFLFTRHSISRFPFFYSFFFSLNFFVTYFHCNTFYLVWFCFLFCIHHQILSYLKCTIQLQANWCLWHRFAYEHTQMHTIQATSCVPYASAVEFFTSLWHIHFPKLVQF